MSKADLIRIAKVIAVLGFFLPWAAISCANQSVGTMSGVDMALGRVTFTYGGETGTRDIDQSVLICAAFLFSAGGLVASFIFRGRRFTEAAVATASVALLTTFGGMMIAKATVQSRALAYQTGNGDDPMPVLTAAVMSTVRIDEQVGYWITIFALAGGLALAVVELSQRPSHTDRDIQSEPRAVEHGVSDETALTAPERVGIGAVVVLFIAGGGYWLLRDGFKLPGLPNPTISQEQPAAPVEVQIGDGLDFGRYTVFIESVDLTPILGLTKESIGGMDSVEIGLRAVLSNASGGVAAEGGTLVVVNYKVQNSSNSPLPPSDRPEFQLRDQNGALLEVERTKTALAAKSTKAMSDLNPGLSESNSVVFEVAAAQFDPSTWKIVVNGNSQVSLASLASPAPAADISSSSEAPPEEAVSGDAGPWSDSVDQGSSNSLSPATNSPEAQERASVLPALNVGYLRGNEFVRPIKTLFGGKSTETVPLYTGDSITPDVCLLEAPKDEHGVRTGFAMLTFGNQTLAKIDGEIVTLFPSEPDGRQILKFKDASSIHKIGLTPVSGFKPGTYGDKVVNAWVHVEISKEGFAPKKFEASYKCGVDAK